MTNLPNLQQILQMGQQMQARLAQMQGDLAQKTVTVSVGGGMIEITADGKGEVRKVTVEPSMLASGDVELLEDLVAAAVNEMRRRVAELADSEMRKVTGGAPVPFGLPGL